MKKIPNTISEEELQRIIKVTRKKSHKVAYLLGFYQCLRISEIVKLQKKDIDMARGFLHIKQAKGNKDRDIPIMDKVKHHLRYIPIEIGIRALERSLKRHAKKAIDKDIHPHTLRHSGASYYLNEKGIDIRYIKDLLGHARISTTDIYVHTNPINLKKAFENT
jgi:site-specific recombinase XerD